MRYFPLSRLFVTPNTHFHIPSLLAGGGWKMHLNFMVLSEIERGTCRLVAANRHTHSGLLRPAGK